MRLAGLAALVFGLLLGLAQPAAAAANSESPFQNWAAVVIAGDWHAHSGGPSEAFDNARRDVSAALEHAGFEPSHLRQFSVRPERYKDTRPEKSEAQAIFDGLEDVAGKAPGGCLFYMSSHGSPEGAVLDTTILTPGVLDSMLDRACGTKPTVVVISACFSGVYVPQLARSNRMILTAARPDRASFGCGEEDKYPYFDDCFLQSIRAAHDFPTLARRTQACVAKKEADTGSKPPSEPQLFIGGALKPILPLMAFPS